MTITIDRPARTADPAGLFSYQLFQTAYVTNDLESAMDIFRTRYGLRNWTMVEPRGMRIALTWTSGHQIELIHTGATRQPLYDDWIDKAGPFVMRLHHFGFLMQDQGEWDLLKVQIEADGRTPAFESESEMLKVLYVDAPEFGHYLEFIFPNANGKAFFESVASN